MIDAILNHIQLTGFMGLAFGYLIGSIPFGLVLTRACGYGDIRKIGSGNIGATNVLRLGNKKLAAATLLLDSIKGVIAILIAQYFGDLHMVFGAALGSVLGHNFPVWLKFKGGKGIAVTFGVILTLSPLVGVVTCLTWLVTAFLFRFSSLAALVALAMTPLYIAAFGNPKQIYLIGLICLIGWVRHHANITRLWAGTESKIGQKS
jgi:acyl phosphate:glycerol-3-phosphate acyltransferase